MKTELIPQGPSRCIQLSVDVLRWPDKILKGYFPDYSIEEVRDSLRDMKDRGMEVCPCPHHICDENTGKCSGIDKEGGA